MREGRTTQKSRCSSMSLHFIEMTESARQPKYCKSINNEISLRKACRFFNLGNKASHHALATIAPLSTLGMDSFAMPLMMRLTAPVLHSNKMLKRPRINFIPYKMLLTYGAETLRDYLKNITNSI